MTDPDLIKMAMPIIEPEGPPPLQTANNVSKPSDIPVEADPSNIANRGMLLSPRIKSVKTAVELSAMILNDLQQIHGCPQTGVNVTVYGSNPWNSWLSFGSSAGPVYSKVELQELCDIITERLKRLYDIDS